MTLGTRTSALLLIFAVTQCALVVSSLDSDSDPDSSPLGPPSSSRDARVLSLFKLYTNFPVPANTKCTVNGRDGHCLKRSQCKSINGGVITTSSCANGIGICCIIELKYTGMEPGKVRVRHSPSHIVDGGVANLAVYEVPRQRDICQLRLDFIEFGLAGPLKQNTPEDGTCTMDAFFVSGAQNVGQFPLCGTAVGQHLYLHYGESEMIKLTLDIGRATTQYDIQVTMVKCSSPDRAPDDCTQYYPNVRGSVRSFNYPDQHLNNHKYTVCVKGDSDSMEWAECTDTGIPLPFFISGARGNPFPSECRNDYITIPGTPSPVQCGDKFTKMRVFAKPYTMYVNFDGGEPEVGPLGPDGCPTDFNCILTSDAVTVCPTPQGICPSTCECTYVHVPGQPGPEVDMGNTGFCLQFTKT